MVLKLLKFVLKLFKKKCPKCGSFNIGVEKESGFGAFARLGKMVAAIAMLPLALLFIRKPKDLMVCRDCGFSWEKR